MGCGVSKPAEGKKPTGQRAPDPAPVAQPKDANANSVSDRQSADYGRSAAETQRATSPATVQPSSPQTEHIDSAQAPVAEPASQIQDADRSASPVVPSVVPVDDVSQQAALVDRKASTPSVQSPVQDISFNQPTLDSKYSAHSPTEQQPALSGHRSSTPTAIHRASPVPDAAPSPSSPTAVPMSSPSPVPSRDSLPYDARAPEDIYDPATRAALERVPSVPSPRESPVPDQKIPLEQMTALDRKQSSSATPSTSLPDVMFERKPSVSGPPMAPMMSVQQQQQAASRRAQLEKQLMEEEDDRSAVRESQELDMQRQIQADMSVKRKEQELQKLKQLEQDAIRKDQQDAENPNLLSFKVVFPNEQVHEVYRYHLPKDTATILDLKLQVNIDFGYSFNQQQFFYKHKLVDEHQVIGKLPDWSAYSVLHFFPTGNPPVVPERIMRPLQREPTIQELRAQNLGPDSNVARDWTAELYEIETRPRDTPLDRLQCDKALFELKEDFVSASEKAVDQILSGNIQPNFAHEMFGSGGEKYFVDGICIRKCANWEILGENVGEGDAAFKAGGHELKCLDLVRGGVPNLVVPLACVVDHYGNRFVCESAVDIGFNTLMYGSSNDGLAIKDMEQAAPIAAQIASLLNLKPHKVVERLSNSEVFLSTPYTVEIHRSESGGYFTLVNAGRLLPPDAPSSDKIDHIVKMLRPELVTGYGYGEQVKDGFTMYTSTQPHSCDACGRVILEYEYYTYAKRQYDVCVSCYQTRGVDDFRYPKTRFTPATVPESQRVTYWKSADGTVCLTKPIQLTPLNPDGYCSRNDAASVEELKQASAFLQDTVIPRFFNELENLTCTPLNGKQLTEEMHKRGINMRYLGRIATEVKYNHLRELAIREMLARTIKVLTRDGLSFLPKYNEADAKAVVLHYLNEIFSPVETESSLTVWKYIEELCHKKFAYVIEETVKDKLYCLALAHSIAEKLGIVLNRYKGYDFGRVNTFTLEDITMLQIQSKHADFNCRESEELLRKAFELDAKGKRKFWYQAGGPERAQATELYREAITVAEFVYGRDHEKTADAYFQLAEQLESRHCENGRPERSRWNRCAGVPADELSKEAVEFYTKALKVREDFTGFYHEDVAHCYLGLARLNKNADDMQETIEYMSRAVDIVETLLGFNHPETAEMYRVIALVYQEANQAAQASPWIRKAFVINMAIFGKESEITRQTWRQLQGIELKIDSGLEDVPIEELAGRIEELHFEQ